MSGLVDGTQYAMTLTFTVTDAGRSFDDIALVDRTGCPPEILGPFLIHLGEQMIAGKVQKGSAS